MSTLEGAQPTTYLPVAANVINKNRFVNIVANAEVDEALSGGMAVGVSGESSAALASAAIQVYSLTSHKVPVEAGAAITKGDRVMSDATGRAITATGATSRVLGVALETAANAGELITIATQSPTDFVA